MFEQEPWTGKIFLDRWLFSMVLFVAARLDGLAKLSSRSNGLEGQIEPEIKRCGPTRVRNWRINASVTCEPRQNKSINSNLMAELATRPEGWTYSILKEQCVWHRLDSSGADLLAIARSLSRRISRRPASGQGLLKKTSLAMVWLFAQSVL